MIHRFLTSLLAMGLLLATATSGYSQSSEKAKEAELKGEAAMKAGDLDAAIANFSEAIRLDAKYAVAYGNRGSAYANKGKSDAAIADYDEASRLDPKCPAAYCRRGEVLFDKHKFDEAIAEYSAAICSDPACTCAYIDRAQAYGIKDECDKQIADAREAYRLNPKLPIVNNILGCACDNCGKMILRANDETADRFFGRVLEHLDRPQKELEGAQPLLQFDGSIEHFKAAAKKLDRSSKAQLLFDYSGSYFKAAIEIRPDYDFANNNLGVYYARTQYSRHSGSIDLSLAEKYFRAALKSNPRYHDAFNNLGIVLAQQGKLDEAIAAHKAGLAVLDRASDRINLSRIYMQKGDLDSALEETANALKCDRKSLTAWATRAEIYERQGNLQEAAKCVQKMIASDAKSHETIGAEGGFVQKCLALNRSDEALALLDHAIRANASVAEIYAIRAEVYSHNGDLQLAKADFEEVLRLRPHDPGIQARIDAIQAQIDKSAKGAE